MEAEIRRRLGPELAAVCDCDVISSARPSSRRPIGRSTSSSAAASATTTRRRSRSRSWRRSGRTPSTRAARHPDLRVLAPPAAARGPLPRPLPRGRRASLARRAPLGPAGPLRRRPALLRLTGSRDAGRPPRGAGRGPAHRSPCRRRPRPPPRRLVVVGRRIVVGRLHRGPGPVVVPVLEIARSRSAVNRSFIEHHLRRASGRPIARRPRPRSLAPRPRDAARRDPQSRGARIAVPRRDRMGRERRHAHRHDSALGGRQRPDGVQELVGARPVHDPQDGVAALGEPDGALAPVLGLLVPLDEPAADQPVDQPARRRRRPTERLRELTDRRRAAVREDVQGRPAG